MEEQSSCGYLQAIVIGSLTDSFVRYAMELLDSYEVEIVLWEDIYWAVGRLNKNNLTDALVIGRYEHLNRQKGRFFEIVSKAGCICCCFSDSRFDLEQEQVSALKSAGGFIVNKAEDIEKVILKLLAPADKGQSFVKKKNGSSFNKDDFLTTQAELEALLGNQ